MKRPVRPAKPVKTEDDDKGLEEHIEESSPSPAERPAKRRPAESKREEIVYDATNERVVLAAEIAEEKTRKVLVRSLSADEFLVPENAAIQRALKVLVEGGLDYDPVIFRRLVQDEGVEVDDAYIAGIEREAFETPRPENLDWYVQTLRWDATRARVLQGPIIEIVKSLKNPKNTPDVVAAQARALLRGVEGGGGRRYIRRKDELRHTYKTEIRNRREKGNFWSIGYDAMDENLTEGTMPGRTGLVVGLSGSGKSTWTADVVQNLAKEGRRVLLGAWEMGSVSIIDVIIAQRTRVPISRIIGGDFNDDELHLIDEAAEWITERVTFMDNAFFGDDVRGGRGSRRSNEKSLDVLEGYIAESGCDVVVMDLWERCLVDLSYDGVTTALYKQQNMHERYNVYGLIVHQLRGKDVEGRADKRPTREAIKGTGAFVEVADQIYGVHRDAQFKRVPDDTMEVICLKQRKGKPNWAVRFDWAPEMGLITGGVEVPYDPGLEASEEFGDVTDVAVKRGPKRRPSRRE